MMCSIVVSSVLALALFAGALAPRLGYAADPPPQCAILKAQQSLKALGYEPGPSDGKWGPSTRAAYANFLRDVDLPRGASLTPQRLCVMQGAEALGFQAGPPAGTPRESLPPDVLHRAVLAGDLEGLEKALADGADVDRLDGEGRTALMYAVDEGYPVMVELLLEAKANPNVQKADGATALLMALSQGVEDDIIRHLMRSGADVSIRGPKGKTALDVARDSRREIRFQGCEGCPEMVVVPAGGFTRGEPSPNLLEKERREEQGDDEKPESWVTIADPFAVGVFEVTLDEWRTCVSGGGCGPLGLSVGGTHPVTHVKWEDTQSYVQWLSEKTGRNYRLLSESEWEYAARAGTRTRYHWGDELGENKANCDGCGSRWDNKGTAPVGSFEANAFGLHDMHGNVWEWVEDCHNGNYEGAPSDGSAWVSSGDCARRMLRGGSFDREGDGLRSADRNSSAKSNATRIVGFRIALTFSRNERLQPSSTPPEPQATSPQAPPVLDASSRDRLLARCEAFDSWDDFEGCKKEEESQWPELGKPLLQPG